MRDSLSWDMLVSSRHNVVPLVLAPHPQQKIASYAPVMENLVTIYKLPKDFFSKVFCVIILYLQPFQILKWRKVCGSHI